MTVAQLRSLCVTAFPLSTTRADVMEGLQSVVGRLERERVYGELWIDGSFLTNKINPNDVDVVLPLRREAWAVFSPAQHDVIG